MASVNEPESVTGRKKPNIRPPFLPFPPKPVSNVLTREKRRYSQAPDLPDQWCNLLIHHGAFAGDTDSYLLVRGPSYHNPSLCLADRGVK